MFIVGVSLYQPLQSITNASRINISGYTFPACSRKPSKERSVLHLIVCRRIVLFYSCLTFRLPFLPCIVRPQQRLQQPTCQAHRQLL